MKIVHVFNMANNGYHMVKALRKHNVEAELIIDSNDFGMGLPMWEDMEIYEDPYNVNFKKILSEYELPEWVKIWWRRKPKSMGKIWPSRIPKWIRRLKLGAYSHLFDLANLIKLTQGYDILHLHPFSPVYLQFCDKPYIIHEAGWIRRISKNDSPKEKLGRRSYERAKCVIWTNPDTYNLLSGLKTKKLAFIPFIIPPEQYKPAKTNRNEELLFFHPSRQIWDIKGNHKLILAFNRFIEAHYSAKLLMVDWGTHEDVKRTKLLIAKNNMEKHVEWVQPYSKPNLIKAYNQCDAVFDQFILGSGGTVCYEAMSCKKPVVIYLNEWNEKCFGEMPPVINARTVDEIYESMILLTDDAYRRKTGESGRKFTMKHNHPDIVAQKLIKIYMEV